VNVLTKEFKSGLKKLDMIEDDQSSSPGLLFVNSEPSNPYERIALENAKYYEADAVYFRRFQNGRPPVPQIYIFDYTQTGKAEDEIAVLHKRLWNSGQVPLFIIFRRTEVKIFNTLKPPTYEEKTGKLKCKVLETLRLASSVQQEIDKIKEFSAKKFDNGSFWETSKYKDTFRLSDSAYETLLKHLKHLRKTTLEKNILPQKTVHRLLVMSILLKYLEERKDRKGNTVFPENYFNKYAQGAVSFVDVLKKRGACLELFDNLSKHFNGKVFEWTDTQERTLLATTDLNHLADMFEAKFEIGGQSVFWPLYSFNDLPIELISNIYEDFLGNKAGIVYTPPYLVNFLIDESMPLDKPQQDFKVLDPACGSGVFLVAAYRRLIYWWRIQNNWEKPGLETLKKILKNNIHGVDKDNGAILLAVFSLSLALCDELSPIVIWEELKFDDLRIENLRCNDFFDLILNNTLTNVFDLIIGNPPFISGLTDSAKKIESKMRMERVSLPDRQIALLFLEQSMNMSVKNGLVCLIMPAGPFLYNNISTEFRKHFFNNNNVHQVIDFTALSEVLFGSAIVATTAVFVKNEKPNRDNLLHITVRRTKQVKEKIYFELDYYDFHNIPYQEAASNRLIWKSNLLGGGRLIHIISKLNLLRSFVDYLNSKKKDNWVIGEGYIAGKKGEVEKLKQYKNRMNLLSESELAELNMLHKKYKKADYLTGSYAIPTNAFTEHGIDNKKLFKLEEEYFLWPRKKEIYSGPHVLIKEVFSEKSLQIVYRDDDFSFKHQIMGIHAPKEQCNELYTIKKRMENNPIYPFYVAAFSGVFMISRATSILKKDIENLPYPEDEKDMALSDIENILVDDVLDYMLEFCRKGENSKAIKAITESLLNQFSDVYCRILNSVYKQFKTCSPIITLV